MMADTPQSRIESGKNPQRSRKGFEDYETFDTSHKRLKSPFADDTLATYGCTHR